MVYIIDTIPQGWQLTIAMFECHLQTLASWRCKRIVRNPLYQLMRHLVAFPEIHEGFLHVKRIFTTSVLKGIKDFFLTLSRPLPVCGYICPSDRSFNLLEIILNINIKDNLIYLKSLKDRLPLNYSLLMAFSLESCFPVEFKSIIFKLIEKVQEPFRNSPVMDNNHQFNEVPVFFSPEFATGTHKKVLQNGQLEA